MLEEGGKKRGEKSEHFYRGSFISAADNHFPSVCIDFSTASLHVVITLASCIRRLAFLARRDFIHICCAFIFLPPSHYHPSCQSDVLCSAIQPLCILHFTQFAWFAWGWCVGWGVCVGGQAVYSLLSSGSISVCTRLLASLMGMHLLLFIRGPLKAARSLDYAECILGLITRRP